MNWKDRLVEQFIPDLDAKVWAVSDPDGIVRNEEILGRLQAKGFDAVFFEEPLAFRYEYESRIRPAWEHGDRKPLVVLFDERVDGFDGLPSDLLLSANQLSFGLRELFPQLDYDVMAELQPDQWTVLGEFAAKTPGKVFRSSDTEELALRVCFKIVPDLIDSTAEMLRRLIELHRLNRLLSPRLAARLARELESHADFREWPIEAFSTDSALFVQFLQERWKRYVAQQVGTSMGNAENLIEGPVDLAFDEPVLRGFVGALFEDEILAPVEIAVDSSVLLQWWAVGVVRPVEQHAMSSDRLQKLLAAIPESAASYRDWIQFGIRYSKLVSQVFCKGDLELRTLFWDQVWPAVDTKFSEWLNHGYGSLHNLPAAPPVMVHHIPKQLARWRKDGEKVALLVLDGLSCSGWYSLRDSLLGRLKGEVSVDDSAAFTWLPSLTPICRQALFSGLSPKLFADTMKRTDCDGLRWKSFWESNGELLSKQIYHARVDGEIAELTDIGEEAFDRVEALGMTISKPDEIMHGMTLGWPGWHQQLQLWDEGHFLGNLLNRLLSDGFTVCLTADHGNLESVGTGKINEGVMAENRGQRVRVYPNQVLRDASLSAQQGLSHELDVGVLPDGCFPIFASGRGAFVAQDETIVAHGGTSLDELLVPWVVLRRSE